MTKGQKATPSGKDGLAALVLADAALKSATEGKTVTLGWDPFHRPPWRGPRRAARGRGHRSALRRNSEIPARFRTRGNARSNRRPAQTNAVEIVDAGDLSLFGEERIGEGAVGRKTRAGGHCGPRRRL
jgi:hypothetical protein